MDKKDADGNVYIQANEVEFGHGFSMGDVGRVLLTLEAFYELANGEVKQSLRDLRKQLCDAQERCANAYMREHYPKHAAAILCKAQDIEDAKTEIGL